MAHNIDVTDFVEVPAGSSLLFTDEKQQANFELGVSMVIHSWQVLEIAVANGWGGPRSGEKRDWIASIVVDLFRGNVVDIELVEETILNAMQDEFDVNVEDDSSLPIAADVLNLYKQVAQGDYSKVQAVYEQWLQKKNRVQDLHVHVHEDPENPDVDEDDDDDNDDDDVHGNEVGQDDGGDHEMGTEEPEEPQGPIIDEDGFELVQKGRRRR